MSGNAGEIKEFNSPAKVIGDYDLIVIGGGPAGVGSAVYGARQGLKTLLVEQFGALGGAGTLAGVSIFLGGMNQTDRKKWVVGGIYREIVEELVRRGDACEPNADVGLLGLPGGVIFDMEGLKRLLDELVTESGADLRFFTSFVAPCMNGKSIEGVFLHNKEGLSYAKGKIIVDCTGDADVAARAGFPFVKGRSDTGLMTPSTLVSYYCGMNLKQIDESIESEVAEDKTLIEAKRFMSIVKHMKAKDEWPWPEEKIITTPLWNTDCIYNNTRRQIGIDGTDSKSLTESMIEGRSYSHEFLEKVIKPHFPGGKNAKLAFTMPVPGIRETRKIVGEYTLTDDDCAQGTDFADTVALSSHPFDLPDPKRPSHQPYMSAFGGKDKTMQRGFSIVPYRCLVPKDSENLLVAGRCISALDMALGSIRTMPPCYAMGQATAAAAKLAIDGKTNVREISIEQLRDRLLEQGAILG